MSDRSPDEPEVSEPFEKDTTPEDKAKPVEPQASESIIDATAFEATGDQPPAEEGLTDEFRNLGKNLIVLMQAAWDRPERRKFQQDLENNLSELGNTLRKEAHSVTENPISQRIKSDIEDIGGRVRSGEVESKVRGELLNALRTLNSELQNISSHLASTPSASTSEESTAESPQAPAAETAPPAEN